MRSEPCPLLTLILSPVNPVLLALGEQFGCLLLTRNAHQAVIEQFAPSLFSRFSETE